MCKIIQYKTLNIENNEYDRNMLHDIFNFPPKLCGYIFHFTVAIKIKINLENSNIVRL